MRCSKFFPSIFSGVVRAAGDPDTSPLLLEAGDTRRHQDHEGDIAGTVTGTGTGIVTGTGTGEETGTGTEDVEGAQKEGGGGGDRGMEQDHFLIHIQFDIVVIMT